jgi:pyrroline-5-carboxylate reductase
VICDDGTTDREALDFVSKIFSSLGDTCRLPEKLMSAATALSGSSPAYGYMFIEAMAKAAEKMGISKEEAQRMSAKSICGAAQMVLTTGERPEKLRNDVCSPGGTTIEAVKVFKEKGLESIVDEAMRACADKADLLGKENDE